MNDSQEGHKFDLYFLPSFYLNSYQLPWPSPNAPLFPSLTRVYFMQLAQAENSRATVWGGSPRLTFSKTRCHQRSFVETPLICASSVQRRE